MKFSELWLREWTNPAIDTQELVDQITMAGLEVDDVDPVAGDFSGVVVGQVVKREQHPDADKLSLCQVSDGTEEFQIVCGAANVREGLKIPFAKIGAVLPTEDGKGFKIKKAKLRGVESFGMLCAEQELGLADSSDGLMELAEDAPVGTDFREYMQFEKDGKADQIIDVDLTPNRGDCLSMAGLAREVGVLNKTDVTAPEINPVAPQIDDKPSIELQAPEACSRYIGRIVKGINVKAQTPLWMVEKLRRSGIRSIDPIVDVTNYVLIELGQPMHAFDLSKVDSANIIVRMAKQDEELTLLDEQEVKLNDKTLVIADQNKALAMAGIFGGLESGVKEDTQDILLESAFFNPIAIAGRARNYGLHTDSSHRYERGVDFELQKRAMERATQLIIDICGGQPGPVVEAADEANLPKAAEITLTQAKIKQILCLELADNEVEDILVRLGMAIVKAADVKGDSAWTVKAPSYRFDMAIEADLIEEIARIYGYNRLPVNTPRAAAPLEAVPENVLGMPPLRRLMVGRGYQEAITYSFVDPQTQQLLDPQQEALALANPLSADLSVMRTNLWAGLVQTAVRNIKRQQPRVRLFETGLSFVPTNSDEEARPGQIPGLVQEHQLAMLVTGSVNDQSWSAEKRNVDFFDLKGDLEAILERNGTVGDVRFVPAEHPALHPGQTAQIQLDGQNVGWIGALHPSVEKELGLKQNIYVLEISLDAARTVKVSSFTPLSKFPEMRRDLALLVKKEVPVDQLMDVIREKAGDYLTKLNLFDIYEGEGIDSSSKSVALGLTFQHPSRTLTDEEVSEATEAVVAHLKDKVDAQLRG